MNLLVDFGNTRIKTALFKGKSLHEMQVFDSAENMAAFYLSQSSIKNCMVASVTEGHQTILEDFGSKFNTVLFTAASRLPFKNLYKSALTLGSDRIAASAGAWTFHPHKNVLTIDAGTCIKYNFVNKNDEYLGGAISPGIPMRLKSMHDYTAKLPKLSADFHYNHLVGVDTAGSMRSGAQLGAALEADEMISRYLEIYPDLIVMLTGGDADYLGSQLKNRFFASRELLLYGLNTILQLHLEE